MVIVKNIREIRRLNFINELAVDCIMVKLSVLQLLEDRE